MGCGVGGWGSWPRNFMDAEILPAGWYQLGHPSLQFEGVLHHPQFVSLYDYSQPYGYSGNTFLSIFSLISVMLPLFKGGIMIIIMIA